MTSDEKADPVTVLLIPPLPVKVKDMNVFIAFAAKLATLKLDALAVILMIWEGGLYIRSEDWAYVALSLRQELDICCWILPSVTVAEYLLMQ